MQEKLIDIAKKLNAEIEVFKLSSQSTSIDIRDGKIEATDFVVESGIGVRTIKDQRLGFFFTTENLVETIEDGINEAIRNSLHIPQDQHISFAPSTKIEPVQTYNREIKALTLDQKKELAISTEDYAYKFDKRIKKTEKVSYNDGESKIELFNSYGFSGIYHSNYYGLSCDVVAEDGKDQESGSGVKFSTLIDSNIAKFVGEEAGKTGCQLLNSKPISPQKLNLLLDAKVGGQLLSALAPIFSSDAAQKGKSMLSKMAGASIASSIVTIVDNGRLKGGIGSSPFDDEGTPTQETTLLDKGVFKTFLYNRYTASKEGRSSTGNGKRISHKGVPDISPTNLYIAPGTKSIADLMKKSGYGLYVTTVMGLHTINPISGEFSIGASGIFFENGRESFPVRGITIAGNLLDFLRSIIDLGSDLFFLPMSGNIGSPSILVENISIAG